MKKRKKFFIISIIFLAVLLMPHRIYRQYFESENAYNMYRSFVCKFISCDIDEEEK